KTGMIDHSRCGEREKFKPNPARADSHGAARLIQVWPRPLGSRSVDADEAAAAPAHLLADRVRISRRPALHRVQSSALSSLPICRMAMRKNVQADYDKFLLRL